MIISPASHKPLYLFHLLHTLSISSALCFTKSVEAATRLAKLVEFFEEARLEAAGATSDEKKKVVVKPYSSELAPAERKAVLRDFKKGEVQMCVPRSFLSHRHADLRLTCRCTGSSAPTLSPAVSTFRTSRTSSATTFPPTCASTCTVSVAPLVQATRVTLGVLSRSRRCASLLAISLFLPYSRFASSAGRALQGHHVIRTALRQDRPRARQGSAHRAVCPRLPGGARASSPLLRDGA